METLTKILQQGAGCTYGTDAAEISAVNGTGIKITFIGKGESTIDIPYDILRRRIMIGRFKIDDADKEPTIKEIDEIVKNNQMNNYENQISKLSEKEKTMSGQLLEKQQILDDREKILSEKEEAILKITKERDGLTGTLGIKDEELKDMESAKGQTKLVELLFEKGILSEDDIINGAFFMVDNIITEKKEKMIFSQLEKYKEELQRKIKTETDEPKKTEWQQDFDSLDELEPESEINLEWHSVSKNKAEKLKKDGKPVIISNYGIWTGILKQETTQQTDNSTLKV